MGARVSAQASLSLRVLDAELMHQATARRWCCLFAEMEQAVSGPQPRVASAAWIRRRCGSWAVTIYLLRLER